MARIRYNHNSFSIGILSKKVQGNTEFEGYNNALDECVNFQIQQTGGLFKRGGTEFVSETKLGEAILILFAYSAEDQYILEFGEKYVRFYTKYGKLTKTDGSIVELVTPFSMADVKAMKTFQEGNVLNLVTNLGIFSLTREATDEFKLSSAILYTAEPLTFMNKERIALKPDKVSGTEGNPITIIAVNPKNQNEKPDVKFAPLFFETDKTHSVVLTYKILNQNLGYYEDKKFYLDILDVLDDTEGFKKITAIINSDRSDGNATELPSTDPILKWQIGSFTADRGMPKAAAMYEGRLFLANNISYPTGIWGSSKLYNDWTDFYIGTNDADGVQFKMNATHADEILWLSSQSKLFAGTRWGIYIGGSATFNDEAITPSNFRLRLFEATGASSLQPVVALDSVFFTDVSKRNVYEIRLSNETGAYEASNISLLANDLTLSGIISHTWQQAPINTYWCAVEDGYLCSLTYLKSNGIMAWAKHVISGKNVKVENICAMHGDKNDLIWMVVRREIDGEFKRYIEYLTPSYDPMTQEEFKQFYVDSGVTKEIKCKVKNVIRGANARFKIKIQDNKESILNALYVKNNRKLEMCFGINPDKEYHPIDNRYPYIAKNTQIIKESSNTFLSFDLFDSIGKKLNESSFSTDKNCNASIFVKISDIFKVVKEDYGYLIYCDTQYLNVGTIVVLMGSCSNNKIDYNKIEDFSTYGAGRYRVHYRTSDYIILHTFLDDKNLDFEDKQTGNGTIFILTNGSEQSTELLERIVEPVNASIEIEEAFPFGSTYQDVYINKVSGTTQLNQQKYTIWYNKEKNVLNLKEFGNINRDIDASEFSPFDTVNPQGNVYFYFNTMDGLDHLIGQEIAVCVDGNSISNMKVGSDGRIVFPRKVMYASVGLPMKAWVKTTPFSGGSVIGSSVGAVGGQKSMWIHLYYSLGGKYGSEKQRIYDIPYTNFISGFNKTKSLITGLVKCPIVNSHDVYDRSIYIEHDNPLSFNILSITQDIEVSDS